MTGYRHLALAALLSGALLTNAPALAASAPSAATAQQRPEPPPRAEAPFTPAAVYGDGVLTEDTVWRGAVLVEGALTIAPQATLTVQPGTVVRFRRKGGEAPVLVVQGRFVVAGTQENPVLFTSSFAVPAAADWQGVMLLGSEKKNLMEYCRIEGAQTGLDALFSNLTLREVRSERATTGMRFQESVIAMESGGVSNCDTGLSLSESEATLRRATIEKNRVGLSARSSSVYLSESNLSGNQGAAFSGEKCRVRIQGGVVAGNGSGVTLLDCQGGVTGAKLAMNGGYGMSLTASRLQVSGNQIVGNGENGLMVFDGSSAAWDNAIEQNAGYDLYNAGTEPFRAPGNWWGAAGPKLFDGGGRGKVLTAPLLGSRPQ